VRRIPEDDQSLSNRRCQSGEAIIWYKEILGFTVIKQRVEFVPDSSLKGIAVKYSHVLMLKMLMAWLSSANQMDLEIFEFVEPKAERRMYS
jgi:hypothetical protein